MVAEGQDVLRMILLGQQGDDAICPVNVIMKM